MPYPTKKLRAELVDSPWYPYRARIAPIPWLRVQATFNRLAGWQDAGTFYRPKGVNLGDEHVEQAEACKIYRMLRLTMHSDTRVRESRYVPSTRSWAPWHEYAMSLGELANQCPVPPHASPWVGQIPPGAPGAGWSAGWPPCPPGYTWTQTPQGPVCSTMGYWSPAPPPTPANVLFPKQSPFTQVSSHWPCPPGTTAVFAHGKWYCTQAGAGAGVGFFGQTIRKVRK